MALVLIPKGSCPCGERERVELRNGKTRYGRFYFVECYECGRRTAKHTTPEEAVREWNQKPVGGLDGSDEEDPWVNDDP